MDKKNIGLLHSLLFAVNVIVLVYAGEQVKTNTDGAASWLMRCSALISGSGIASLGISFLPAMWSNTAKEQKDRAEQVVSELYMYDGVELDYISRSTVCMVDAGGRDVGYFAAIQDTYDCWNKRLTYFALASLVASVLLFGIGVFVL